MKDLFIQAHEELIAEYLEHHPEVSEETAYDDTADLAYDRMREMITDQADFERQRRKEGGE